MEFATTLQPTWLRNLFDVLLCIASRLVVYHEFVSFDNINCSLEDILVLNVSSATKNKEDDSSFGNDSDEDEDDTGELFSFKTLMCHQLQ